PQRESEACRARRQRAGKVDPTDIVPADAADVVPADPGGVGEQETADVVPANAADIVPADSPDVIPADSPDVVPADATDVVPSDSGGLGDIDARPWFAGQGQRQTEEESRRPRSQVVPTASFS